MTEQHECEWNTRYTKRFYADGVEWFCIHCGKNLAWPEAKRRVNEYKTLKKATEAFVGFMDEYYSIKGKVEPLKSDIDEDGILKAIYAKILEGK